MAVINLGKQELDGRFRGVDDWVEVLDIEKFSRYVAGLCVIHFFNSKRESYEVCER